MNQREIWKKYITAQSKILEYKSRPISVDTSKEIKLDGLKLQISIDQEIFKQVFKKEVEEIFNIEDFDFKSGYIQTGVENIANINYERLIKLKELAEICYIDFNENPVIEGIITTKSNNIKNEIEKLPTTHHFKNSGLIFLTIEEYKKIININGIQFAPKIGAVYPIKPSLSFVISTFYKQIKISQNYNKITVIGELHQNIYGLFAKHFGLEKHGNCLIFKFQNAEKLKEKIEELKIIGIRFLEPQENYLYIEYDNNFYETHDSNLNFEVFRLQRTLKKYFADNPFEFSYSTHYIFDNKKLDKGFDNLVWNEDIFWDKLFTEI
ncbi:MAG: hypothetical protein ORN58_04850, partial [Sediminibacterium sp.]|nr:hypothetical protein [Sediminibacterium sp.]